MERGIASGTIACMRSGDSKKRVEEIWVMIQMKSEKRRGKKEETEEKGMIKEPQTIIISAWRYPGTSPKGKPILIPADVLEDLENFS